MSGEVVDEGVSLSSNELREPKYVPDQVVDRKSTRSPSHDAERHCSPGYMDWPTIRHGEFDDDGHEQEAEGSEACGEAENQQNRKEDFPRAGEECHHSRDRKVVGTAW